MGLPWQSRRRFNPYRVRGLEARYDYDRLNSLVYDGSNKVQLTGDLSGNSAVNGLVLNGASGQWASTPSSNAVKISGDIWIDADLAMTTWTPGSAMTIAGRWPGGTSSSYQLQVNTTGNLLFVMTSDGSTVVVATSSAAVGFAAFSRHWVAATRQQSDGAVKFYTSTDGITWVQLGTTQILSAGSAIYTGGTGAFGIGAIGTSGGFSMLAGIVYRVILKNGYDGAGTTQLDANFTTVAKLAASFSESSSNAATVTVNTSGDLGARISGARDHLQMTAANQRVLTIDANGNYATDDGSNDYSATANFSLSQPFTRYTLFKQKTWTSGDILWSGRSANTGKITQTGTTPNLQLAASSAGPQTNTFVLDTWALVVEVVNGASSSLARNLDATTVADAGTGTPNGDTLGSDSAGANNGHLATALRLIYAGAHDLALQKRISRAILTEKRRLVA